MGTSSGSTCNENRMPERPSTCAIAAESREMKLPIWIQSRFDCMSEVSSLHRAVAPFDPAGEGCEVLGTDVAWLCWRIMPMIIDRSDLNPVLQFMSCRLISSARALVSPSRSSFWMPRKYMQVAVRIHDRRHDQAIAERLPVGAVIHQVHRHAPFGRDGHPQLVHVRLGGLLALQEPAVPPDEADRAYPVIRVKAWFT